MSRKKANEQKHEYKKHTIHMHARTKEFAGIPKARRSL